MITLMQEFGFIEPFNGEWTLLRQGLQLKKRLAFLDFKTLIGCVQSTRIVQNFKMD